jgi:ABC-2 type transport system permease protein
MRKIGHIAAREFVATVGTRGFIVGLLIMPALITVFAIVGPRLFSQRSFRATGQIAIVDPTGVVAAELRATLDPAAIAARREKDARLALALAPEGVRELAQPSARSLETTLGQIPDLHVVERPPGADIQQEKEWLRQERPNADRHLALAVIHPDAVVPADGGAAYGTYDLYLTANLDDRIDNVIQQNLRIALVAARARAQNLDRDRIDALTRVDRVRSVMVTKDAERPTSGPLNRALPFAFTFIVFFGVMMGGQTLMTSTIEEKSSRVAEVLLSAVSPFELMAGKILGQMGVSLVALALYVVMGIALLVSFALFGLVDIRLLLYLAIFFVIAFLVIGSLMAAIGAAVNEMKEAQSLMGPIMIMLVAPLMLQVPISQNPNSTFSTVISFIPPVNAFTMLIRMASSAPPPLWQVWLSIAVGVASVFGAVWFAAKVFRIGLLMYGKPPDFATLIRWVRAA